MITDTHNKILAIFCLIFALMACGGVNNSSNSPGSSSSSSSSSGQMQTNCDTEDVHEVFARNQCMTCHNAQIFASNGGGLNLGIENIGQSMLDATTQHGGASCIGERLIDASNPENSLLLKLVDPMRLAELNAGACKRQAMPQTGDSISQRDLQCLESWIKNTATNEKPIDRPKNNPEFEAAGTEQALSKLKYVLHGGAVTAEELTLAGGTGSSPDREALKLIIASWEESEEYKTKISDFLDIALQQRTDSRARYIGQLNGLFNAPAIDARAVVKNLREMFTRTAWDIVLNDRDFREVVTTRKWQVTSAALSAIAYADKPNQTPGRTYLQPPRPEHRFRDFEHFIESDYNDWRYVEFVQSNAPFNWSNLASHAAAMRAIKEGDKIRTRFPRVGFFSTPAFNEIWATNDDNQFRVTAQQTLITALDKAFTTDDPTPHKSENGIPLDHADPQSVCYQCHRLMDPLRLIFSNYQVSRNRAKANNMREDAFFTLSGVSRQLDSVDDFANTLANHERFSTAWLQKLCMWGNSQRCSEVDSEFIRLTKSFVDSNFNFKSLIRDFFSSPLFTMASDTATTKEQGYFISMSRGNHFCHAISARVSRLNQLNGTDDTVSICDQENNFGIISGDTFARGNANFIQSTMASAFDARSIDSRCSRVSNAIFAQDATRIIDLSRGVDAALRQLVEVIIGLPNNHSRHALTLKELTRIYQIASHPKACDAGENADVQERINCGFGLSAINAMRSAWFAACTSPDLNALGL